MLIEDFFIAKAYVTCQRLYKTNKQTNKNNKENKQEINRTCIPLIFFRRTLPMGKFGGEVQTSKKAQSLYALYHKRDFVSLIANFTFTLIC